MERDELLELCERYVRRRRVGSVEQDGFEAGLPPVVEIVDGYLHAEISESEKNSLLAYVRGSDHDFDLDGSFGELDEPAIVELEDPGAF